MFQTWSSLINSTEEFRWDPAVVPLDPSLEGKGVFAKRYPTSPFCPEQITELRDETSRWGMRFGMQYVSMRMKIVMVVRRQMIPKNSYRKVLVVDNGIY